MFRTIPLRAGLSWLLLGEFYRDWESWALEAVQSFFFLRSSKDCVIFKLLHSDRCSGVFSVLGVSGGRGLVTQEDDISLYKPLLIDHTSTYSVPYLKYQHLLFLLKAFGSILFPGIPYHRRLSSREADFSRPFENAPLR